MYKLCKCGEKIPLHEYQCNKCKKLSAKFYNKTYDNFSRDKLSAKFYSSVAWKKARARVIIEIGDILEVDEKTANLMIERCIASEVKTTKKKTDETNKNTTKKR